MTTVDMKYYRIIIPILILGTCALAIMLFLSQSTKDELACDTLSDEIRQCDSLFADLAESRDNVSTPSLMGDVEYEMIDVLQKKDSLKMLICASSDVEHKALVKTEYDAWLKLKDVLNNFVTNAIEVKYLDDPWRYAYGLYFKEDVLNLRIDFYSKGIAEVSKQDQADEDIDEAKSQILGLCNNILDTIMIISDETDDPVSTQYTGHIKYNKECASKSIKLLPNAIDNWVEANISMRGEDSTTSFLCRLYGIIKEDTK